MYMHKVGTTLIDETKSYSKLVLRPWSQTEGTDPGFTQCKRMRWEEI